jgi:hypothetical protein
MMDAVQHSEAKYDCFRSEQVVLMDAWAARQYARAERIIGDDFVYSKYIFFERLYDCIYMGHRSYAAIYNKCYRRTYHKLTR